MRVRASEREKEREILRRGFLLRGRKILGGGSLRWRERARGRNPTTRVPCWREKKKEKEEKDFAPRFRV